MRGFLRYLHGVLVIACLAVLSVLAVCNAAAVSAQVTDARPAVVQVDDTPSKQCCGPVTAGGQKLVSLLDKMDVEHLWLSHHAVHWRTGFPKYVHGQTHCSAFAAAVADRLGVYLLRPPEHSQNFLASAQGRWLDGPHGRQEGWSPVSSAREAQALANRGYLVVLVHISPESEMHGHIAVVRPAEKTEQEIDTDGPETIQAGLHNFTDGNAVESFGLHAGVWPSKVGMYAHETGFSH